MREKYAEKRFVMAIVEAFLEYGVKLILFAIVAGVGIGTGIKIRKMKDAKSTDGE